MWRRINRVLKFIEDGMGVLMLISATVVLLINVLMRYCFGAGISWAEEFIRYSLIGGAFIGSAAAMREKSHVSMTMLVDFVKNPRAKAVYGIVLDMVTLALCLFIIFLGVEQTHFLSTSGQQSAAMRVPMYIPYLAIPIGFVLMTIRIVQDVVEKAISLRGER